MTDRTGMVRLMMRRAGRYRGSFAGRLFASFVLIAMTLALIFFVLNYWYERAQRMQDLENNGRLLSSILAFHSKTGVFAENRDMLNEAVEGVVLSNDVLVVRILDVRDGLLYEYRKDVNSVNEFGKLPVGSELRVMQNRAEKMPIVVGKKTILFTAPVVIERPSKEAGFLFSDTGVAPTQPDMIGYVQLAIDLQYHTEKIMNVLMYEIFIGVIIFLTGGGLIFWQIGRTTKPLVFLTEEVRSFGEGKPFNYLPAKTNDEVGRLAEAFNAMTEALQSKEAARLHLESQFRQAQKMETVGTLAGGIAHDFQNILTAISGFSSLAKMSLEKDDPVREYVEHILTSSSRGATLVQSLLAFSRKQIINSKAVVLNSLITNVQMMLRRLLREDIRLVFDLSKERLVVMADSGQIDQVLMNLCTNARDAMPDGGILTISTSSAHLEEGFLQNYDLHKPGAYALISVADSGTGMDKEILERIFDPFFTTKGVGKGSGLGLSSVYGSVKQHGGFIDVRSEIGKGTVFSIYLPLIHSDNRKEQDWAAAELKRGSETVLVAEDDEEVRLYIYDILRLFGYKVIEAVDGEEAIRIFSQEQGIDLLLLDVVMPGKNGREVFDAIRILSPEIRALFLSGHSDDIISKQGVLAEGINFIGKPVSPEELLVKIREILDSET